MYLGSWDKRGASLIIRVDIYSYLLYRKLYDFEFKKLLLALFLQAKDGIVKSDQIAHGNIFFMGHLFKSSEHLD